MSGCANNTFYSRPICFSRYSTIRTSGLNALVKIGVAPLPKAPAPVQQFLANLRSPVVSFRNSLDRNFYEIAPNVYGENMGGVMGSLMNGCLREMSQEPQVKSQLQDPSVLNGLGVKKSRLNVWKKIRLWPFLR